MLSLPFQHILGNYMLEFKLICYSLEFPVWIIQFNANLISPLKTLTQPETIFLERHQPLAVQELQI